jgi:hypothetical protein
MLHLAQDAKPARWPAKIKTIRLRGFVGDGFMKLAEAIGFSKEKHGFPKFFPGTFPWLATTASSPFA